MLTEKRDGARPEGPQPEARRAEERGRRPRRGRVLGEGQRASSPPARGPGGAL